MKENKSLIREKIVSIIIAKKLLWESVKLKFKEITGYESEKDKQLKKLRKLEADAKKSEIEDNIKSDGSSKHSFDEIVKSLKKTTKNNIKGLDEGSNPITVND